MKLFCSFLKNLLVLVLGIIAFILLIAEGDTVTTTALSKVIAVVLILVAWLIHNALNKKG